MAIIEIKNLYKYFHNNVVLNNLSFKFEYNNTYLLVGANGSGKSTLIKIILGFVKETQGRVKTNEKTIGYVPEKSSFPEMVNIKEFLYSIANIRNIPKNSAKAIIEAELSEWKLDGSKKISKLSKGMMQKVSIIQSLIHSPKLYIFDEPMSGLDEKSQKQFLNCIKNLKAKNKTIIIATHFKDYYQEVADKVVIIKEGTFNDESN